MKRLLCIALFATLALAPSLSEAYWIDVSGSYWNPTPSGTVAYSLLNIPFLRTPDLDVDKDLGFEEEGTGSVRAKVDLPFLNVGLMATPIEFESRNTLTRDISFGGHDIPASTKVTSTIMASHYDFTLFWNLPLVEGATFDTLNVEFGLNARKVDFEISVTSPTTTTTRSADPTIPMLYLGVQINFLESLGIDVEYRGVSAGDNEFTDMIAMLRWKPVGPLYIGAGYRSESLKLNEKGIVADMDIKGPYGSLGLRF